MLKEQLSVKKRTIIFLVCVAIIIACIVGFKLNDKRKEVSGPITLESLNRIADNNSAAFNSNYSRLYTAYCINSERYGEYVLCVAEPTHQREDNGGVEIVRLIEKGLKYQALGAGTLLSPEFTDDCRNYICNTHSLLTSLRNTHVVYCIFENPTVDSVTVNGKTVKVEKFKMVYNNREVNAGMWAVLIGADEDIVVS